jgi:Nucleotide modification associated domain 3
MHIVFSRKGFDSGSGGYPSPILKGRPISLPIPTKHRSETTYEKLGLGDVVESVTHGKITGDHLCHEDPMFAHGRCAFGQTGAAQAHLSNQGVGVGDVFLFFGLFSDEATGEPHHRIYSFLRVENKLTLGPHLKTDGILSGFPRPHPHTIGEWNKNNTLYVGPGLCCRSASNELRLSKFGGPVSVWQTPPWLHQTGLSYHGREERWLGHDVLRSVARGQEFVANIDAYPAANVWLDQIIVEIKR